MVKKLKAIAKDKDDNQLARAIRDSAHQIWLAGLGAFAKARDERSKIFDALVKEGRGIHQRTREAAGERFDEVAGKVSEMTGLVGRQASDSWDRLEQVFEDRVARALGRLGVPSTEALESLAERLDAIDERLQALEGGPTIRRRAAAVVAPTVAPGRKATARSGRKGAATKPVSVAKTPRKPRKASAASASDDSVATPKAARKTGARKARTPAPSAPAAEQA